MKNTYYFIIILSIAIACQSTNSVPVRLNPELIDDLPGINIQEFEEEGYHLVPTKQYTFDLNQDSELDTIVLKTFTNWNDPGDFLEVEISLSNEKQFKVFNSSGWVVFNQDYTVPNQLIDQNLIDSQEILILKLNENYYLFAFGWVYASIPGLMTMIEFSDDIPRVAYNGNTDINSIGDINSDGVLDIVVGESGKTAISIVDNQYRIIKTK